MWCSKNEERKGGRAFFIILTCKCEWKEVDVEWLLFFKNIVFKLMEKMG